MASPASWLPTSRKPLMRSTAITDSTPELLYLIHHDQRLGGAAWRAADIAEAHALPPKAGPRSCGTLRHCRRSLRRA